MKKSKTNIGSYIIYGNLVCKRPEYHYEVIGRPSLARRILGYPFGSWDIIEIKRINND